MMRMRPDSYTHGSVSLILMSVGPALRRDERCEGGPHDR